jgi:hypothetical protein
MKANFVPLQKLSINFPSSVSSHSFMRIATRHLQAPKMLLPAFAILATLCAFITASPTPQQHLRAENGTLTALATYHVTCKAGGNTLTRCYEGGSANCRCDSYGSFLCPDQECRGYCTCDRYIFRTYLRMTATC